MGPESIFEHTWQRCRCELRLHSSHQKSRVRERVCVFCVALPAACHARAILYTFHYSSLSARGCRWKGFPCIPVGSSECSRLLRTPSSPYSCGHYQFHPHLELFQVLLCQSSVPCPSVSLPRWVCTLFFLSSVCAVWADQGDVPWGNRSGAAGDSVVVNGVRLAVVAGGSTDVAFLNDVWVVKSSAAGAFPSSSSHGCQFTRIHVLVPSR